MSGHVRVVIHKKATTQCRKTGQYSWGILVVRFQTTELPMGHLPPKHGQSISAGSGYFHTKQTSCACSPGKLPLGHIRHCPTLPLGFLHHNNQEPHCLNDSHSLRRVCVALSKSKCGRAGTATCCPFSGVDKKGTPSSALVPHRLEQT